MTKSLPHFHYPDYGSVDLVLSVLENSLCGANLFFNLDKRRKNERSVKTLRCCFALTNLVLMQTKAGFGGVLLCYIFICSMKAQLFTVYNSKTNPWKRRSTTEAPSLAAQDSCEHHVDTGDSGPLKE